MKLFKSCVVGLCAAFLLCGCASYRVKPLRKLTKETAQFVQEKNNIQVCASRLDKKEFKKYTNGHTFSAQRKLVPVLVTVYNNGKSDLVWRAQEIRLTCLSTDDAAQHLGYINGSLINVGIGSFAGFILGGYGLIGLGILCHSGGCCAGLNLISAVGAVTLCGALPLTACILASTYYGHQAFNNMLLIDLREKMLSRVDIVPGDFTSKLLIAHEQDLAKPFIMNVRAIGTEKTTEFVVTV
jgi:hypothetical protein